MAEIKQNITGDVSGLEKELKKLQKEVIRLREENSRTTKESVSENSRHQRSLKKLGESVKRDVATPMEQYRSKLTQLREAHKAGHLTQEQYRRGVDKMKDSVRRNNQETSRGEGLVHSFAGAMVKIGGGVAIWNAVTQALAGYNQELERRAELEKGFTNESIRVAKQQSMFLSNTASLTPESRQDFLQDVQGVSREIGYADVGQLTAAAGGAFSASYGDTPEDQKRRALEATRAAGRLTRLRPEETQLFAGGALDIMKATGVDDSRQALNYLQALIAEVRIEDSKMLLKSAPKAVSDIVATDRRGAGKQSAIEAGAIFGVLTSAMVDETGDVSKTAGRQFSMEMERFFTNGFSVDDSVVKGAKEGKELIKPTADPGNPLARLRAIQRDPELAKAFMGKASLGEAELVVRKALDPSSMIAQSINSKVTNLNANAFGTALFDQQVKEQSLGTPQINAASEQAFSRSAKQARDLERTKARRTRARDLIDEIQDNSYLHTWKDSVEEATAIGPLDYLIPNQKYSDKFGILGGQVGVENRLARGDQPEQVIIDYATQRQESLVADQFSIGAPSRNVFNEKYAELEVIKQEMIDAQKRQEEYMRQQAENSNAMLEEMKGMRDDARQGKSPDQQTTAVGVDQHR